LSTLLTGCSSKFDPMEGTVPPETPLGSIQGIVHGGHQADVGAAVYVYQAGTGGYKSAAKSLLTSTPPVGDSPTYADGSGNYYVLTNSVGSFNITGDYTCTSGSQVYLYVLGGNTGGGSPNPNAGFLAVLGQCPASGTLSGTITNVYVNEVSTLAAAYALAGYAADATHIGGPATTDTLGQTDMANAFANASNLYNIASSGSSPGALATTPAGNGTVPQSKINSLANSLAACVNTTGSSSTSPNACNTLLGDALSGGTTGTTPSDTATAAINIAHNPTANVSAIFGLATGTAIAYGPFLSAPPSDWTVTLTYSSTYFSTPTGLAIDASGNAWVTEYGSSGITELSPLGKVTAAYTSTTYFKSPYGSAIDPSGNIWFNAGGKKYVDEFIPSSTGVTYISGYPVAANTQMAIDGNGYYYTPAYSGITTEYIFNSYNSGTASAPVTSYGFTSFTGTADLNENNYIAVDSNNVVWTASDNTASASGTGLLLNFTAAVGTGTLSGTVCSGTNFAAATGVAVDHSNNVWLADYTTGYLVEFANSCTYSNSYSVGTNLQGVAIDGSSNIFTLSGYNLVKLSNAGAPLSGSTGFATGITAGTLTLPAVDGSGDVWFVDSNNTVSEVIGVATPVVTPISAGVKGNTLGYTP
jgi:streptogramin lyase